MSSSNDIGIAITRDIIIFTNCSDYILKAARDPRINGVNLR